jgi:LPS-assembly lipoprotein
MRRRCFGLLLVASSLLLTSCGFHLRGTAGIAERYQPLVVARVVADGGQEQMIRRALERAGALPGDMQTGANRLNLVLSRKLDTFLNSRRNNDLLLVELRASLSYSLVDADGASILTESIITSSQTVELDSDNVLSHNEVLNEARDDQDSALLRSLIGRLRN